MEVEIIAMNLEIGALLTVIRCHSSWIENEKRNNIKHYSEIRRSEPKK
jgi:hypothetical protein